LLGFVAVCGTVAYSVAAPAPVPSLVTSEQLPTKSRGLNLAHDSFLSGPRPAACWSAFGAAPAFGFAAALP
jgi:hypothetical protein